MADRRKRVLFHVQSMVGIGHIRRAAAICTGLDAAGIEVHVAFGGIWREDADFGGARFHQLPPVRAADLSFKTYLDADGREIDDAWRDHRRQALQDLFDRVAPDLVLLEMFPFGRRVMRFELLPLLDHAKTLPQPPGIFCSVRDILVEQTKASRVPQMRDIANRYLDCILVHGDPALIPFDATFPETAALTPALVYTGYATPTVRDDGPTDREIGRGEVIVSCGGGATGGPMLRAAIAARPMTRLADRPWRLMAGPHLPAAEIAAVTDAADAVADGGIRFGANSDRFADMLRNCLLSVSHAGYNTTLDLLATRCRSVVVPVEGADRLETEQPLRARLLAERGVWQVVPEDALTPENLAVAIDQALDAPPPPDLPLGLDGVANTVREIDRWLAARP